MIMLDVLTEIFKSLSALSRPKVATSFFRHRSADGFVLFSFPPGGGQCPSRGY